MILLSANEKIEKAFEVKASSHGRGTLYITSFGIAFESIKYGLVLDVSFEWLRSYNTPKHDKFELIWDTPSYERFRYLFKLESGRQAVNACSVANRQYADSMSEIESLKTRIEQNNLDAKGAICDLPPH